MDALTPPDPLACLPRDAYAHLIVTLRATLPPTDDTPQALANRDHAAIAQVAALCPVNAAEAALAGQYVAANAQAMDCLRLARDPDIAPEWALRCTAQAASMMRQAQGAMRLLLRAQATRTKLEADSAAVDRAAWTEHCATQWMAQALPPAAAAPAAPPQPPGSAPQPDPSPAARDDTPSQNQGRRPVERSLETNPIPAPPFILDQAPATPTIHRQLQAVGPPIQPQP